MSLVLLRLFIAALWLPAGKRVDLLALVGDVYCILLLSHVVSWCQVWYLIVSFPDLCNLSYFLYTSKKL